MSSGAYDFDAFLAAVTTSPAPSYYSMALAPLSQCSGDRRENSYSHRSQTLLASTYSLPPAFHRWSAGDHLQEPPLESRGAPGLSPYDTVFDSLGQSTSAAEPPLSSGPAVKPVKTRKDDTKTAQNWAYGIEQCTAPVSSTKRPVPAVAQRRLSDPPTGCSPIALNQLAGLHDFHAEGQQATPERSPRLSARHGTAPVLSFHTWQRNRAKASASSPSAQRHDDIMTRMKREKKRVLEHTSEAHNAPAAAAATANTLTPPADRRTSNPTGASVRSVQRVSVPSSGLDIHAPLSNVSVIKSKRASPISPHESATEPIDRRHRVSVRNSKGGGGADELGSSLMPENRMRSSRLTFSSGSSVELSFGAPHAPPAGLGRGAVASSMMPRTRAALLNGPPRGVESSLVANGRLRDVMLDSVSSSVDSAGLVSLGHYDIKATLNNMRHSYDPELEASHRAQDLSDEDADRDMGSDSYMPSMFRRNHTRRASDSTTSRRRLVRTDSHEWLAGLSGATTTRRIKGSFSYLASAPTAEDPSDSDGDAALMHSDDDLSIHSSSYSDESTDASDAEDDDEIGDCSALVPDRVVPTGRVPRLCTSGRTYTGSDAPQMGDWRPSRRVPQPQPNLLFHIGRGGCINPNLNAAARTPQPPVAFLLGFDIDACAQRVPSPDWSRDYVGQHPLR